MGTLVGVDIGTLCGVAWKKDSVIRHIQFDTSKARISGGGMRPLMLRRHLIELFSEIEPIEELGFELVQRHSGTYAGQIYGELRGVLMCVCEEMSIPYRSIGVTTIKKHLTGNGIASKDVVRQAIVEKYPKLDPQTEDEADAISILQCVIDGVF